MRYSIIPEIKKLLKPLSPGEYARLENNILAAKRIHAKIVLANIKELGYGLALIDGHNRVDICDKHDIEIPDEMFEILEFEILAETRRWVIENQIGRRNLKTHDLCAIGMQIHDDFAEQGRQLKAAGADTKWDTSEEVTHYLGVSAPIYKKYRRIHKEHTEVLEAIHAGDESISGAYNRLFKTDEQEQLDEESQPENIITEPDEDTATDTGNPVQDEHDTKENAPEASDADNGASVDDGKNENPDQTGDAREQETGAADSDSTSESPVEPDADQEETSPENMVTQDSEMGDNPDAVANASSDEAAEETSEVEHVCENGTEEAPQGGQSESTASNPAGNEQPKSLSELVKGMGICGNIEDTLEPAQDNDPEQEPESHADVTDDTLVANTSMDLTDISWVTMNTEKEVRSAARGNEYAGTFVPVLLTDAEGEIRFLVFNAEMIQAPAYIKCPESHISVRAQQIMEGGVR